MINKKKYHIMKSAIRDSLGLSLRVVYLCGHVERGVSMFKRPDDHYNICKHCKNIAEK